MYTKTLVAFCTLCLSFACTPKSDGGGDTGETGETGETGISDVITETGNCYSEAELNAGTHISFVELNASGDSWGSTPAVIASQAELDDWHAASGLEIDASGVDFETQVILFSQVTLSSTCGALAPVIHVVEMEGAPHLSLELTNPDGACDAVCDMTWTEHAIVAVDKNGDKPATVCAREIATCVGG